MEILEMIVFVEGEGDQQDEAWFTRERERERETTAGRK